MTIKIRNLRKVDSKYSVDCIIEITGLINSITSQTVVYFFYKAVTIFSFKNNNCVMKNTQLN